MNQIQRAVQSLAFSTVVLALATTTQVSATYAETYIAGQFGVTLPSVVGGGLGEGDLTGVFIPGSKISEQSLEKSILYGGKIGHYFRAVPWLGLELEVYNTTPHIKQQSLTFTAPSGAVSPPIDFRGLNFRVLTIAPNLTFRYHKSRLQPYVAVGPGIFFAHIKDPSFTSDNTQSSVSIGVNAAGGIRYYITRNLAIFGEGKFNYARLSFEQTPPGVFNLFGFDTTYMMFHAAGGISLHF